MKKSNLRISVLGRVHPYKGGISHYNSELCNHLSKKAKVQVISYSSTILSWIHPWRNQIDKNSDDLLKCKAQFIFDILNPLTLKKTAKCIADFKPDVFIFHSVDPYYSPAYYIILHLIKKSVNNCKIFAICHEPMPYRVKTRFFSVPLNKLVLKNVDTIFVHSSKDYENVKRILPDANVKKIFHPIYDFFYKKVDMVKAKKKLNLKGKIMLFFGYIRRDKGLNFLIQALSRVISKIDVTLLIVGEFQEDKEKYMQQIRRLKLENNVKIVDRYVGNNEVPLYFSAADVIVTPYVSGSQSGVINIAYAFNKPVITTNVGGLGEIVKAGKTGYVVKSRNSQELADAIIKFYNRENIDRFRSSIVKFKKQFSWDRLCNEILKEVRKK